MPLDLFAEEQRKPLDLFAEEGAAQDEPKSDIGSSMVNAGKSALGTLKNLGKVYPALETAANLATSTYGLPISGLAGVATLPFGLDKAAEVQKKVAGALIYEPQTKGGQELTQAATYPLEKLEQAGGYAGGKLEEAGYPMAGAAVHSAIQAIPLLLGARGGPKRQAVRAERKLNATIDKGIEKSIRPGVEGKRTFPQTQKYMGNAREAVKTIAENKDRLSITNELGESTGKLPETLKQFSQAIDQTKRMVFNEYDAMAKAATGADITVDLSQVVNELKTIASNKTVNDFNPSFAEYATGLAERLKDRKRYTANEAQDAIATLNKRLDAFYKNPTYENASLASIDSMVANQLRSGLDAIIEEGVGKGYQELKHKYGSLKAIERDVNRRAIVDARKNIRGLIDFSDIFSGSQVVGGILSLNPAQVMTGVAAKGIANWIKYINSPNRVVKKMFREVEQKLPEIQKGVLIP